MNSNFLAEIHRRGAQKDWRRIFSAFRDCLGKCVGSVKVELSLSEKMEI
jgi:hypothetical protein